MDGGRVHFHPVLLTSPKLSLCPKRSLTFAAVSILEMWLLYQNCSRTHNKSIVQSAVSHSYGH